tara:strand:- start:549 stop:1616 length:1068 start_codon:yes stop_codon:yes gene_type:complete
MKKLLYLLLLTPIIYLTSCSKSGVTPQSQSLEDVIVGTEWCLSNANEDGFLLAEDGKFYLTEKCQSNTPIGNWVIDGDLIKYQFTDNTQEITILWGEVIEYSESQIKLLDYSDSLVTITDIYILDPTDIYGCMDVAAPNYNPAAECDDGSCGVGYGCTDSTACYYNPLANFDDGSCLYGILGCTDATAINFSSLATCDDGSCTYLAIGDTHQGGIIFYLDGNGGGLIAAPSDQEQGEWGCYGTAISGANGTAIGTGNQNTIDIEAGCITSGTAADICANLTLNGYSDWFLPSKEELNKMWLNLHRQSLGGFDNWSYWSSTEYDNSDAWKQYFGNDLQIQAVFKEHPFSVRAIRAF